MNMPYIYTHTHYLYTIYIILISTNGILSKVLLVSLFFRDQTEISAVCVFSLSDISKVMEGPFKELKKSCENWINPDPVPIPRPGQVLKP